MKSIENRLEKLEMVLGKEDDLDLILSAMTPQERERRIAELIYKGLIDTDPEVMNMTESEFVSMYLAMSPEDREDKYDQPIYEQLTGGRQNEC